MVDPKYDKYALSNLIKKLSVETGFFDCGISKAKMLSDDAMRTEKWLSNGYNANMHYMEKNKDKRYDPHNLVDGAKSVISFLYNYYTADNFSNKSCKISRFAYGIDYHKVIKDKLFKILDKIKENTDGVEARVFVDSAPLLERAWAMNSGLGFIGKNTMLISKKAGSFFFIGNIILNLELQYDKKYDKNHCGNCTACIDACPTNAITPEGVDSNKCISYLTIEHKEGFPSNVNLNNWIFGCDICQEVCPWNRFAIQHHEKSFLPSVDLKNMVLDDWKKLSEDKFKKLFKNSAVNRTGYKGITRNIDNIK